jgi:hypothetical protein
MAEIDVVPKHRSNLWLWIVLAIVVVGLVIWAMSGRSRPAAQLHQIAPVLAAQPAVYHELVALA